MGRPIVHWELMSEDPAKVSAFYEKIFGSCGNRLRSKVEATIAQEGNKLLRRLLQGHLNRRAKTEERRVEVAGADGVVRRPCRAKLLAQDLRCSNKIK